MTRPASQNTGTSQFWATVKLRLIEFRETVHTTWSHSFFYVVKYSCISVLNNMYSCKWTIRWSRVQTRPTKSRCGIRPDRLLDLELYTGCNRRNGPNFGRVFLRSNYTDITKNTYIQSSMVTEILAREKCDFFGVCVLYSIRDVILVVSAWLSTRVIQWPCGA